ncbi:hypothetical protein [Streptomyces pseudogriseolus]|uniref:hypothetical protein n=1 Tax=Streptomyces pseudogriseolus TaxID=36817 RepID=UPI003FA2D37E
MSEHQDDLAENGARLDGKRRLARTEQLGREANDELTAALTPAERDQLMRLLAREAPPDEPCAGA